MAPKRPKPVEFACWVQKTSRGTIGGELLSFILIPSVFLSGSCVDGPFLFCVASGGYFLFFFSTRDSQVLGRVRCGYTKIRLS